LVQQHNAQLSSNLSDYLSDKLHLDYNYLSSLFSELENISIEKFFIAQKIEKVKELMIYDELSLSQIADMLQYSSVAYLSNQFKRTTGFSPRQFKQMKGSKRKALDQL
jgi:AraC-like DNA-binding protein